MLTKKEINNLADSLLIGLSEEEIKLIELEFDEIHNKINIVNTIPNIKEVVPLTYPFDIEIDKLRDDTFSSEEIEVNELFSNSKAVEGREIVIPKVVGE